MKRNIPLSLACVGMLLLSACSTSTQTSTGPSKSHSESQTSTQHSDDAFPISKSNVQGLWERGDHLYYFAEDGQFISFTDANVAGGNWKFENSTLLLNLYNHSLQLQEEIRLNGTVEDDEMSLIAQDGTLTKWDKEDDKVRYIESELYYLERIALPPEVLLEVNLTQNKNTRFLSRSVSIKHGMLPIVFRTYYLEENLLPNMPLELDILVTHENSFLFTANETILFDSKNPQIEPIRLTQPNPNEISELILRLEPAARELANTYWKLIELNGNAVYQNFDTEPHVIFHKTSTMSYAGDANGNDGCNSFFSSWKRDDDSIQELDIELGGSTMRLCNDDKLNMQVRNYMKALSEADSYHIQGSRLFLKDDSDTLAIFEAVDLQ